MNATIVVNGRDATVRTATLTHADVVGLSGRVDPGASVAYRKGAGGRAGTLAPGQSVAVAPGMVFNVASTRAA